MRIFLSIFILIFTHSLLYAELIEEIELSKDEIKSINLFVNNTTKTLSFRWTLYKDRGLVMHLNYDNNPHQFILYKEKLNSFKIPLSHTSLSNIPNPYIIIYFIDFDSKDKKAKFRYYLYPAQENIGII